MADRGQLFGSCNDPAPGRVKIIPTTALDLSIIVIT
jgi:hypothetical protein